MPTTTAKGQALVAYIGDIIGDECAKPFEITDHSPISEEIIVDFGDSGLLVFRVTDISEPVISARMRGSKHAEAGAMHMLMSPSDPMVSAFVRGAINSVLDLGTI